MGMFYWDIMRWGRRGRGLMFMRLICVSLPFSSSWFIMTFGDDADRNAQTNHNHRPSNRRRTPHHRTLDLVPHLPSNSHPLRNRYIHSSSAKSKSGLTIYPRTSIYIQHILKILDTLHTAFSKRKPNANRLSNSPTQFPTPISNILARIRLPNSTCNILPICCRNPL